MKITIRRSCSSCLLPFIPSLLSIIGFAQRGKCTRSLKRAASGERKWESCACGGCFHRYKSHNTRLLDFPSKSSQNLVSLTNKFYSADEIFAVVMTGNSETVMDDTRCCFVYQILWLLCYVLLRPNPPWYILFWETSRTLTSININANASGTTVLVSRTAFSIADFFFNYCRLLFDEIRIALNATTWK